MILEEYKNHLVVNGASNSTTINYLSRIKMLLKKISIEELSKETINAFLLEIGQNYSESTRNFHLNAIKSFLKFLEKDIPLPKIWHIDKKLPQNITLEYFEKEIIPVVESVYENPLKLKTIFYFMFYTGIRVSEVGTIYRKNIDLTKRIIQFYVPKTKSERLTFFPEKVENLLRSYFSSEPEFTNAFNMNIHTLKSIFRRLKPHFRDINLHPHLFRHSFAVMFLMNGGDIATLSKLLGHKRITTTMRYAGLSPEQLQKLYNDRIK